MPSKQPAPTKRQCQGCFGYFEVVKGQGSHFRRYCNDACRDLAEHYREKVKPPKPAKEMPAAVKVCAYCSKTFMFTGRQASQVKYCSDECARRAGNESIARRRSVCPHCGKAIGPVSGRRRKK